MRERPKSVKAVMDAAAAQATIQAGKGKGGKHDPYSDGKAACGLDAAKARLKLIGGKK